MLAETLKYGNWMRLRGLMMTVRLGLEMV